MHALVHGLHIVYIRLGLPHFRDRFNLMLKTLNGPQYRRVLEAVRLTFYVNVEGRCTSKVFVQRCVILSELGGFKEETLQAIDDCELVDTVKGDGDNHYESKPDEPSALG